MGAIMGVRTQMRDGRCRSAPVAASFWPSRVSLTFTFTSLLAISGLSLLPERGFTCTPLPGSARPKMTPQHSQPLEALAFTLGARCASADGLQIGKMTALAPMSCSRHGVPRSAPDRLMRHVVLTASSSRHIAPTSSSSQPSMQHSLHISSDLESTAHSTAHGRRK